MKQTWKKIAYAAGALALLGFLLFVFGMREVNQSENAKPAQTQTQQLETGYTIEQTKYWTKVETLMLTWDKESRAMFEITAKLAELETDEDATLEDLMAVMEEMQLFAEQMYDLTDDPAELKSPAEYAQLHAEYIAVMEEYADFLERCSLSIEEMDFEAMAGILPEGAEVDQHYKDLQEKMRLQKIESHKNKNDGI